MSTTGASNDLERVASTAKRMIREWGMSEKVGLVALSTPDQGGPFMGRQMGQQQTRWGSRIMGDCDAEVERLVNNSYITARKILEDVAGKPITIERKKDPLGKVGIHPEKHSLEGLFIITTFQMSEDVIKLRVCGSYNKKNFLKAFDYYSLWDVTDEAR